MQAFFVYLLATPLVVLVVLNVVGPALAVWDRLRHPDAPGQNFFQRMRSPERVQRTRV